jgi:uncharacterized protein HemX
MQTSRARPPAVRRRAPVRRRKHAYASEGRVWLAVVAALVIAAAGAIWGARAQLQSSRAHSELAALQRRVAGDERTNAGLRRHLSTVAARTGGVQRSLQRINWTLQSVPSEAQLAGVRNHVAAYAACLPQLQREIDGLGLSWRINAAKPSRDSFRLFTSRRASSSCIGR